MCRSGRGRGGVRVTRLVDAVWVANGFSFTGEYSERERRTPLRSCETGVDRSIVHMSV